MKKQQLDHVLRAAGRITGEKQFIVIGSQSLHAKHADLPDELNEFVWPGFDLHPIKGDGRIEYGFLPPKFFERLVAKQK